MTSLEYAINLINCEYKHAIEFGVYKGDSLKLMKRKLPKDIQIFGFDSFKGLPEDWRNSNGGLVGGHKTGSMSTGGVMPKIDGVKIYPGWFINTLPKYLEVANNICLLHIDCDLYNSTVQVLFHLEKWIKLGTIIVFDEWFYMHSNAYGDHEQKAFYEWTQKFDRMFEFIDFDDKSNSGEERRIIRILN